MQVFIARVFVKHARRDFDEFRREAHNSYVIGSKGYSTDIMEVNR